MEFEKWTPTTYLFWAALMVVINIPGSPVAAIWVAGGAFGLSLVWQLVQWIIIRRQRKAKTEEHLTAWNYKG